MNIKINILSPGRFHVLDLARELEKLGYDVRFYSYVRKKRCIQFGLPSKCCSSFFILFIPIFGLRYIFSFSPSISKKLIYIETLYLDTLASIFMRRCDVFIGMSGLSVRALKSAKKKGAITLLERGSKHILEQARILDAVPEKKKKTVPLVNIKRELFGYELADYIVVPSDHAMQSFLERGFDAHRLFQNPYGVDISMFTSTIKLKGKNIYDVIMVGNWSYQKGVDLLTEACLSILNLKLLHVGGRGDYPFPKHENFTHIDPVNQPKLQDYYAQSKIFVLPSRQEGLALVQGQALACGLPVVCSQHTGGRDLQNLIDDQKWIIEMQEYSINELVKCIQEALELYDTIPEGTLRNITGNALTKITWEAYGKRYSDFLKGSLIVQ